MNLRVDCAGKDGCVAEVMPRTSHGCHAPAETRHDAVPDGDEHTRDDAIGKEEGGAQHEIEVGHP